MHFQERWSGLWQLRKQVETLSGKIVFSPSIHEPIKILAAIHAARIRCCRTDLENDKSCHLSENTSLYTSYFLSKKHDFPQVYEVYWPIFESQKATLEMRVAALTLLLISNPTPARLISIHRILNAETDPHMINYYRTTIKSITETTFPCYSDL